MKADRRGERSPSYGLSLVDGPDTQTEAGKKKECAKNALLHQREEAHERRIH